MGRKTTVHDANADLVRELRVPSDADDSAIQEALMKLFNDQVRDQTKSIVIEGQANRAKRSVDDQVLKESDSVSDQFSLVQSDSRVQDLKISSVQDRCSSIKQQSR